MFLALFPGMFNGFVLALSCVGASSLIKTLALVPQSQQFIWFAIGGWVLLMALVFLAPLLLFIRPLYLARERALIEYGKLAQIHHQAFHEIWISGGKKPEEMMGDADPSSTADLHACVQSVLDMRLTPLDRDAVFQILASAAIPFLAVLATQVPLSEIFKWIFGVIF